MNNKLPKVFQNKIEKKINNNNKFFYSANKHKENDNAEPVDVRKKINEIFSSTNYIYKASVLIKLSDKTFNTKIIGRNKNYLITMDNKTIPIDEIKDISIKK